MEERVVRKKRLSPEEKLRIVEEAASKEVTDAEVCRRWGIEPWDLRRFREQVRKGALAALAKKTGPAGAGPPGQGAHGRRAVPGKIGGLGEVQFR